MAEEKEKEEEVKKDAVAVLEKSEEAIAVARELLTDLDAIFADPKKRKKVATGSGMVLGGIANLFLDAKDEVDEEKRNKLAETGALSVLETGVGFVSSMIAGNRRRMEKKKQGEKIEKAKVVKEEKKKD